MGKLKKKKIKRTPLQLQKMREKRNQKMMENQLKKKMEIENRIKLQNDKMMEIKNQLTEDDWNDIVFHITHSKYWKNIQKEGLKGGDGTKWGDVKGCLYLTTKKDRELWNGIGTQYVFDFDTKDMKKRLGDKDVTVIGIPKKVLELMDCTLYEDNGGESMNYDNNHIKVLLGRNVISPSLFKKVDEFKTDIHHFENVSIWKYIQRGMEKHGFSVELEELSYEDGFLGHRTYENRFDTTSKNYLKLSKKGMLEHSHKIQRDRILRGTQKYFSNDIQNHSHQLYSEVV